MERHRSFLPWSRHLLLPGSLLCSAASFRMSLIYMIAGSVLSALQKRKRSETFVLSELWYHVTWPEAKDKTMQQGRTCWLSYSSEQKKVQRPGWGRENQLHNVDTELSNNHLPEHWSEQEPVTPCTVLSIPRNEPFCSISSHDRATRLVYSRATISPESTKHQTTHNPSTKGKGFRVEFQHSFKSIIYRVVLFSIIYRASWA